MSQVKNIADGLAAGTVLRGKAHEYVISKALGQGSFGITYLAETKVSGGLGSLNLMVAIKEFFMSDNNSRGADGSSVEGTAGKVFVNYRKKFLKEAGNLSTLDHPGIVKVLESFEANNTVYYSMAYLSNGSLNDHIARSGGLSEEEALAHTRKIAEALEYMHSRNMLHLDLKPGNIMIADDGSPVLIDFGLSKSYTDKGMPETSTSIGLGTPGYAPIEQSNYNPEQTSAGVLPVTMDIYALGGTLYKMLTGSAPPQASKINEDGFPSETLRKRGISEETISFVEWLMRPKRKERPQSIAALLECLPAPSGGGDDDEDTIHDDDIEVVPASVIEIIPEPIPTPVALSEPTSDPLPPIKPNPEPKPPINPQPVPRPKPSPTPTPTPKPVNKLGLILGIAAGLVLAVALFFVFKGGQESPIVPDPDSIDAASAQVRPGEQPGEREERAAEEADSFTNETTGSINGHEWVDLGLTSGLKWATCNVGASSASAYGDYYAWGETSTKDEYNYNYDNSDTYGKSGIGHIGGTGRDVARQKWGYPWRMPSQSEFQELLDNCNWTWTTQGGKNGYKVTSKSNGNSIFLPAAGWRNGGTLYYGGSFGYYWSSTPYGSNSVYAQGLYFDSGLLIVYWSNRNYGLSVRPVSE